MSDKYEYQNMTSDAQLILCCFSFVCRSGALYELVFHHIFSSTDNGIGVSKKILMSHLYFKNNLKKDLTKTINYNANDKNYAASNTSLLNQHRTMKLYLKKGTDCSVLNSLLFFWFIFNKTREKCSNKSANLQAYFLYNKGISLKYYSRVYVLPWHLSLTLTYNPLYCLTNKNTYIR